MVKYLFSIQTVAVKNRLSYSRLWKISAENFRRINLFPSLEICIISLNATVRASANSLMLKQAFNRYGVTLGILWNVQSIGI